MVVTGKFFYVALANAVIFIFFNRTMQVTTAFGNSSEDEKNSQEDMRSKEILLFHLLQSRKKCVRSSGWLWKSLIYEA